MTFCYHPQRMFPTLVRIGNFEITTFGLMMFLAFVVGGWVMTRELKRRELDEEIASSFVLAAALGGIIGAKVYYAILYKDVNLLFSRAGLVWYGGMIGGFITCSVVMIRAKAPYLSVADAAAPGASIGYALGRMGCFLVGDDYGRPTDSFVGVAFPKGAPPTTARSLREFGAPVDPSLAPDTLLKVHPTQLYEVAAGVIMFIILMKMSRANHPRGTIFGWFCILLGLERFLVEFLRAKDDRFLGSFTVAQLISVILIAAGVWLVLHVRTRRRTAARA